MTIAVAVVLARHQATGSRGGAEWLLHRNLGLALGCLAATLLAVAFAALWTHLDREATRTRPVHEARPR